MWIGLSPKLHHECADLAGSLWTELFDSDAPDSYQPRLHNSCSLVDELTFAAELAASSQAWNKSLTPIKDELKDVVKQESDVLATLPRYQHVANELCAAKAPSSMNRLGLLLQEDREQYQKRVIDHCLNAARGSTVSKKAIELGVRRLATIAVQNGRSEVDVKLALDPSASCEDVVQAIVDKCKATESEYEVWLLLRGRKSDIQSVVRRVGFSLQSQTQVRLSGLDSLATAVSKNFSSSSLRHAARNAAELIRPAIDIYNLYCNNSQIELMEDCRVGIAGSGFLQPLHLGDNSFRRLHARKNAVGLTQKFLDLPKDRVRGRLLNALELHSLAHGSSAAKVRLVNLWAALECLVGGDRSQSIIVRVNELLPQIIAWRRVEKMMRYAAICLHSYGKNTGNTIPKATRLGNDYSIDPRTLMRVLAKPEDHPALKGLFEFCADSPMLKYRMFRLREEVGFPKVLAKSLRRSEERTRWHLGRIYRARNMIVHTGVESPYIAPMLDNLQYYFSLAISRVIHGMGVRETRTMDEAATYWQTKFGYVTTMLSEGDHFKQLTTADFFPGTEEARSQPIWE
ncbi:MAG: hypothetical protein Aurels2KO_55900 [Aureliella sp.]